MAGQTGPKHRHFTLSTTNAAVVTRMRNNMSYSIQHKTFLSEISYTKITLLR